LTLLLLGVVGLRRPWDLRAYTHEGLALLTTRRRAYGYRTVERFLTQVAQAGGAEPLTDALARWTTRLWKPEAEESQSISPPSYVDGHRKPVFSDYLLPRGVIGRTGKILGCRTLLLLHDEQGHPLLATTHRGDLHLTLGTPSLLSRYETATDEGPLRRLVIDREGMAAEFLANLGMWVREQYFPAMYAHATWNRLLPFFRLPGRVTQGKQTVWVELRPFNDRQLNRDLRLVCERVEAAQPRLPDGRRLRFSLAGTRSLSLDGQRCKVA
jgi:hypothetical protein